MTNKQESLEVKAYQCPYHELGCNYLSLNQEEVEKHANILIEEPLPTGLVYIARRIEAENHRLRKVNHYEVVLGKGKIECGDKGINLEHSYNQPAACFSYLGRRINERLVNSRIFRQDLVRGDESYYYEEDFGLLTEKEFERVSKFFPSCLPSKLYSPLNREKIPFKGMIRTTDELDKLSSRRKTKPLKIRKQFPLEEFIGTNGHKRIFRTTIETCGVHYIDAYYSSMIEVTIRGPRGEQGYPDKIVLNPEDTQEFLRGRKTSPLNFNDFPVIALYEGKLFTGIIFDEERIKRRRRRR